MAHHTMRALITAQPAMMVGMVMPVIRSMCLRHMLMFVLMILIIRHAGHVMSKHHRFLLRTRHRNARPARDRQEQQGHQNE